MTKLVEGKIGAALNGLKDLWDMFAGAATKAWDAVASAVTWLWEKVIQPAIEVLLSPYITPILI